MSGGDFKDLRDRRRRSLHATDSRSSQHNSMSDLGVVSYLRHSHLKPYCYAPLAAPTRDQSACLP